MPFLKDTNELENSNPNFEIDKNKASVPITHETPFCVTPDRNLSFHHRLQFTSYKKRRHIVSLKINTFASNLLV